MTVDNKRTTGWQSAKKPRATHSRCVSELPSTPAPRCASEIGSASPLGLTACSLGDRRLSSDMRGSLVARASAPESTFATNRLPLSPSHSLAPAQGSLLGTKRPFLTGSAPQTEFDVSHSKQTSGKFLTGARMHVKDFEVCTPKTRNLTRVNERNRYVPLATSHYSLATDSSILPGSGSRVENDVTHSKQKTEEFLPGATT